MHYVIGDVHGCFDQLMALFRKIEDADSDAKYIFVGDFVDRGPKVTQTLNWAMKHITRDGKYRSVIGNHEFMILEWYHRFKQWSDEGCDLRKLPITEYDFLERAMEAELLSEEGLKPIMDFFLSLPFRIEISVSGIDTIGNAANVNYIIAHAWDDPSLIEEKRRCDINLWERNCRGNKVSDDIIVHGHTPTFNIDYSYYEDTAPGMIGYRKNAINVDGGCTFAGLYDCYPAMLCGICLETLEEFYAESLEENFKRGNLHLNNNEIEEKVKSYSDIYLKKRFKYREEMLRRIGG